MSDVVYRSEVRIKCIKGPFVTAYLPAEPEPFIFGLRGAVARALPRSRNPRYNARLHCRRCARATGGFRMSLFGLEPRSHVSAADHECIVLLYTSFCRQSFISRQGSGAHGQQPGSRSLVNCSPGTTGWAPTSISGTKAKDRSVPALDVGYSSSL